MRSGTLTRIMALGLTWCSGVLTMGGDQRTVYPTRIVSDRWEELFAPDGALLSPNCETVKLAAPSDLKASPRSGPGGTLEFDPGWRMTDGMRPGCFRFVSMRSDSPANDALEKALGAVFRITNGRTSGTCFLVAMPGRSDQASVVLVTSAHVLEEMSEAECQLVLRAQAADQTYSRKVVTIPVRENGTPRWKRHAELDVAAVEITLPSDVAVTPIDYEQLADAAWVAERNLRVGQQVWIATYPAQLAANEAGWPVLRIGAVASYPLSPVSQVKTILVDCSGFGGDSGAPVLSVSNGRCHVVGLVHGMHRQTDKVTLPFEELTFHTPLGLSIAVQAAFVRDTIQLLKPPDR